MLLLVARRDKTTIKVVYRLTDEVPYLFAYCALFCPYLHKDKATKQITASGCLGQRFLIEHCKTIVFPHFVFVSVFNAHRKSVKRFFARYSSAPRCRARDTYITMTIAKVCTYHSFSPF